MTNNGQNWSNQCVTCFPCPMLNGNNFVLQLWENQKAHLTFSFSITSIVEIKTLGAKLFPCLNDVISIKVKAQSSKPQK
jgi:hypothetical protein